MRSTAAKKTVSRPELPPIPPSLWLPFWLHLKAQFGSISCHRSGCRSILMLAPVQPPFWLRFKLHSGCVSGASLWLCFSKKSPPPRHPPPPPPPPPPRPLSVSAPQVAGLLPGMQISGRSRLRPFVWGGILPLFSHLACNLNTQNISCLTNRP